MNGIHDLGGMDNFGPVLVEQNEPVFHHDWERTMFSLAIALLGAQYFKVDEVRRATEWIPPLVYLRMSYYEGWLRALIALLGEKKLVSEEELSRGHALHKDPAAQALPKEMALYAMNNPLPTSVPLDTKPRFKPGDRVLTRVINAQHHTRLPRYARGRHGSIDALHPAFLLPDTNGHGGPDRPQHLYSVRFEAHELWGEDATQRDAVYIDLFEDYLEPPA
jgi:nitrile hydratase